MKNSVGLVCRKSIKADNDADVIKLMKNTKLMKKILFHASIPVDLGFLLS